jgi:Xaa-Pro aminopeptidase
VNEKGRPVKELESFLKKFSTVYSLGQASQPVTGKALELRTYLDQTRRKKDEAEVRLFKQLATIAKEGYKKIEEILQPGITEKEIRIAFESEIMKHGAHGVPYESIVGAGPNAAILHALPTERKVQQGELVLVDAGADIYDYCVDITRMFPSSDAITSQHKSLYQLVLQAHTECIAMSKPGVLWGDVHLRAAQVMTEGLLQLGILRGSVDELMDKGAIAVFFPHGIGHLVGLRVRDTGHEERKEAKIYAGARVRVEIELEAGHFITVEPGCYFIDALLNSQEIRNKHKESINWTEVEKWKGIGGVRIEDNILITENGNDNLTKVVPKTISGF